MRFGTRTDLKRRWTPQGHRPRAPMKIGYQFAYLYTAICPFDGQVFAMILPYMNKECFAHFVNALNEYQAKPALLIADRASTHQPALTNGTKLTLRHLPSACPELNPVERFFKELRGRLANRVFDSLEQAYKAVENVVRQFEQQPQVVSQLTLFPYIQNTQPLS